MEKEKEKEQGSPNSLEVCLGIHQAKPLTIDKRIINQKVGESSIKTVMLNKRQVGGI